MLTWLDHLIAALLLVVWPLYVARYGREEMRDLTEHPEKRLRAYRTTILFQWAHAFLVLGIWWWIGRQWTDLGVGLPLGWGFAVALALAVVVLGVIWNQWVRVRRDPQFRARLREQLPELQGFVPTTPNEVNTFRALAVTAGICEELVYRGFLLWYLGTYMPLALAVPLMMVAFGAGHLYQGVKPAAQIAAIAGIAALFYMLSGSLWIPIVLHTLVDLNQVAVARAALQTGGEDGEPVAA